MRLQVRFRYVENCFVSLPAPTASSLFRSFLPASVGLQLTWADAAGRPVQALVGWSGTSSEGRDALELSPHFASCLGLREGQAVGVEPADKVATATMAFVEPLTPDDWEIVELNAGYVEQHLLEQVQYVYEGETLPIWIWGDTVVFVRVTQSPRAP
eukprot:m51a1_g11545 putative peroxisomal biogenesis factor 1 (156) ;mRNA; f:9974-11234